MPSPASALLGDTWTPWRTEAEAACWPAHISPGRPLVTYRPYGPYGEVPSGSEVAETLTTSNYRSNYGLVPHIVQMGYLGDLYLNVPNVLSCCSMNRTSGPARGALPSSWAKIRIKAGS